MRDLSGESWDTVRLRLEFLDDLCFTYETGLVVELLEVLVDRVEKLERRAAIVSCHTVSGIPPTHD